MNPAALGPLGKAVMICMLAWLSLAFASGCSGANSYGSGGGASSADTFKAGNVPSERSSDSLYSMSASEFFNMKKVKRPIDLNHIDDALLLAAIFYATNQQRTKNGLSSLQHLAKLDQAAMIQSKSMAEGKYLSHTNPNNPKQRTPRDRVLSVGLNPKYVAENVATAFGIQYKSGTQVYIVERNGKTEYSKGPQGKPISNQTYASFAQSLVGQWMGSPEHRKNISSKQAQYLGKACALGAREQGIPQVVLHAGFHGAVAAL